MTKTVRIGFLDDMRAAPPSETKMPEWLHREIDTLTAAGRLPFAVEIVPAYGLGLPSGTAEAVERAYAELADAGVLLIVGPAIGDNALIATPLAEKYRVPTINWAGAERARGEWMFHLQVGSHEDESLVIARYLASLGARQLAVAYDISPIGIRHLEFLKEEAALLGLEITGSSGLNPLCEDASALVEELLRPGPDAFVYLGLGLSAPAVAGALVRQGWEGPRMMNTAGIFGYRGDFAQRCDGWTYIDMWSSDNRTLAALMERLDLPPGQSLFAAMGYDLARVVAEGLARAPDLSREGVKLGLERIKWLPAAEGHDGTQLGFGVQDRGALHGRYLVVRRWQNGESVEADSLIPPNPPARTTTP